jgi:PTS system nitrogen regulatory IIA component
MQLTLPEVAKLFGVSENVVTRWIRQDNLPAHEVNSQYRFHRTELLEWAALNQQPFSPRIFQELHGGHAGEISLADAMDAGGVVLHTSGNDRYEVFRSAIADLPVTADFSRQDLLELLITREKAGGTAIGHGIAIPHPRYPIVLPGNVRLVRTCYLDHPLDYHASDRRPVDTLFLLICPTTHDHLQLLARLTSLLSSASFRELLATRPDKAPLVAAVRAAERQLLNRSELQQV